MCKHDTTTERRSRIDFFCGWCAGCIETCILYPANKIIFRQQLHGVGIKSAICQLRTEGLPLLYRGLLPPLIQRTTARSVMFGMYDKYQHWLGCDRTPGLSMTACHAQAAFLSGATEALLCPFERIQALLQTSAFHDKIRNTADAFQAVRRHGVKEFYRGISAIVIRNSLSNVLFFTMREPLMSAVFRLGVQTVDAVDGRSVDPNASPKSPRSKKEAPLISLFADFISGAFLGATISTIFFPVNAVKIRMQSTLATEFLSPWAVFRMVWDERNRSLSGLYRGVQMNFGRSLISWGITNTVYELLKRTLEPHLI
ncbi:Mitochondrial carrier triple repeat protein 1 [Aphelenchoides avenae]|nr:Mitochondrial carrier triple repeat protein 1 [Aphelenchus avenae]